MPGHSFVGRLHLGSNMLPITGFILVELPEHWIDLYVGLV